MGNCQFWLGLKFWKMVNQEASGSHPAWFCTSYHTQALWLDSWRPKSLIPSATVLLVQQQHITDKDIILKWVHQYFLCSSISHSWTDTDIILIAGAKEAEALYWEVLKCPRQSRTSPDLAHLINVEVEVNAKKVHLYDALMLIFKSTPLSSHCQTSRLLINVEVEVDAEMVHLYDALM